MTKLFTPTPGLWALSPVYGGWEIKSTDGKLIGVVPTGTDPLWQTECNARLARAAPSLLGTMIRQHNYLGLVKDSHDPRAMARSIQKGIRTGFQNAIGTDIALSGHAFEENFQVPAEETD